MPISARLHLPLLVLACCIVLSACETAPVYTPPTQGPYSMLHLASPSTGNTGASKLAFLQIRRIDAQRLPLGKGAGKAGLPITSGRHQITVAVDPHQDLGAIATFIHDFKPQHRYEIRAERQGSSALLRLIDHSSRQPTVVASRQITLAYQMQVGDADQLR